VNNDMLAVFEEANGHVLTAITEYQAGILNLDGFISKISPQHVVLCRELAALGMAGKALSASLELAYQQIKSQREEFIVRSPASYHQVLFEAHRLLLDTAKKGGFVKHRNTFIGWKNLYSVPREVRLFSKRLYGSGTFVRTKDGWRAYIHPRGGCPIHFSVIVKTGNQLNARLSDYLPSRAAAIKDILSSRGAKHLGTSVICRAWLDDSARSKYNYIIEYEGKSPLLGVIIELLFRSQHMFWLEVKAPTQEEAGRKERLIIRHLLESYLITPNLPLLGWGDAIGFSTLANKFGACSDNETVKTLNELIRLPKRRFAKTLREKYRFMDTRLFP